MKARLFGTDGVRGVAYKPPLDRATVARLGAALAESLRRHDRPLRILLAGDTRASTADIAAWMGGSFIAAGGQAVWAGVLPTPAVSHLVRETGTFAAGVIVSASHNPARDNGIKLVTAGGTKFPVADEHDVERRIDEIGHEPAVAPLPTVDAGWGERYLDLLVRTLPAGALAGQRLVVDAANGAGSPYAGELFSRLGAEVALLNTRPTGHNINRGCGALHPEVLAAEVVRCGAVAGVALDGDADRAILVTGTGRVLNGDDVLLLWARALARRGALPGAVVVATVMSNLGLEDALREEGIRLVRCPVGDRAVWETMEREGAALGGEQSGHVICRHHAVTGDGLLTAVQVLALAVAAGRDLESQADLRRYPQIQLNLRVAVRRPLAEVEELTAATAAAEQALDGHGRVFIRYSGTEPLLRIMVEAASDASARSIADHLAAVAREQLGSA